MAEYLSPLQRALLDVVIEARKEDASFINGIINVTKKVTPTAVKVTPTLVQVATAVAGGSSPTGSGPSSSGDDGLDELIRYRESLR